ncbi:MAG: flagellar basal body rod protein FlgC [Pseudomonadota bacterium]
MSLNRVFDIAGSAMAAQSARLNTTASNLANADSVSGDPNKVYRARQPIFSAEPSFATTLQSESASVGVRLRGIVESQAPLGQRYAPEHPDADENGNVWTSNVSTVEEMVNMLSASRSYQSSIEVMSTTKELLMQTLSMGRS